MGREHGKNVVFAQYEHTQIARQIRSQITHGRYDSDRIFGIGDAGLRIAQELATLDFEHPAKVSK
jgi:hypothetical protein